MCSNFLNSPFAALLAAEKLSTILIVGGIVLMLLTTCVVLIFVGIKMGKEARLGRIPTGEPPDPAGPVKHLRGTPEAPPPEVRALGPPEHVHGPMSLGDAFRHTVAGLFGQKAAPNTDFPTYISFRDSLVFMHQGDCILIPWDQITDFLPAVGFTVSTGEKFLLTADVENYGHLYDRLHGEMMGRGLEQATQAIESGGSVTFEAWQPFKSQWGEGWEWLASMLQGGLIGPFTISAREVEYNGRSLPWSNAAGITLIHYTRMGFALYTVLTVRSHDRSFNWCRINLDNCPNSFVLLELLRRFCPPHLLTSSEPAKSRWW